MSSHADQPEIVEPETVGPETVEHATAGQGDCGTRCQEALDRLFEYIDSELGQPDAERIRMHLQECKPCLEEFDTEAVVKKLVRRSCREAAPVELRARIHAQLVTGGVMTWRGGSQGASGL